MTEKTIIDYTNKDYESLRKAMLDLARYRLPEWTDRSSSDPGIVLLELFAYMGDIILYYQDRIANESFLKTATQRLSIIELLRLIGYELTPAVSAFANLAITFNTPGPGESSVVTIPRGAQFETKGNSGSTETFEYLDRDLQIDLSSPQVEKTQDTKLLYKGLSVRHSKSMPSEILGSSTGEPNQSFRLSARPLILESLDVEVNEGSGWVQWTRQENLLYHHDDKGRVVISDASARDFYVQHDENNYAYVHFGDGVYGMIPPVGNNNIRARYRIGGGITGNVTAGLITKPKTKISFLDSVTNPEPSAGGTDEETIEHAKRFAPLVFRSSYRAVTLNDFVALAHKAGGVAKVRARSRNWNQVDIFIAPKGDFCSPVPDNLRRRLLSFFEDKRMVSTIVNIHDAKIARVEVGIDLISERNFDQEMVRQKVREAVQDLFAYANVDFGQPIYLSKIYEAIEAITGVHAVNVTKFRREDDLSDEVRAILTEFGVSNIEDLPAVVRHSIDVNIAPDGKINIDEFEIPVLGKLNIIVNKVT